VPGYSANVASDLGPAIVSGSVAAIAVVTTAVTSWRSLAHQRRSAQEARTWDAIQALYVDLLVHIDRQTNRLLAYILGDQPAPEPPAPTETALLDARVQAFASSRVRDLYEQLQDTYESCRNAVVGRINAGPEVPEDVLKAIEGDLESRLDQWRREYWNQRAEIIKAIRAELQGFRIETASSRELVSMRIKPRSKYARRLRRRISKRRGTTGYQ
jgi:hypothetical protein